MAVIPRAACEAAYAAAVRACDPALRVAAELAGRRFDLGLAIGKAALAMARGAGPVARGLVIAPQLDGAPLPLGWTARDAGHPEPDARSLAAGDAAIELVDGARPGDAVLALISGGASALCERPRPGVTLDQLRAEIRAVMASGADIHAINARRVQLSAIKGGQLAARCAAPVTTLALSDVFDDDIAVIGSGPTIAHRPGDTAIVIAPIATFARAVCRALGAPPPVAVHGDVARVAAALAPGVSYGEPTIAVPADHGEGGRAQQLALELARALRGRERSAFVAGSDGIDGPPPRGRPAPAGAYVDGATWDAIAACGIDPGRALARCDAGPALAAVGALFVPGPTGVNHADLMIVG
ncbi:MAG TPA: DUF4147 domain-containing protein [Kofleriaceae bacterium]|nr:DUF4147 domain-containing protein [Kofleriaceae bacterium]